MRSIVTEKMLQRIPSIQLDKKSVINEEIYKNGQNMVIASFSTTSQCDPGIDSPDILDLERISNRIHEKNKSIIVNDREVNRYLNMKMVDYEKLKENDRLLKKAYDMLFQPNFEKYPVLVQMTEELIARLERKPHLYCPYQRRETTKKHVSRWLNNHTNNPVAELSGFSSKCPYEPKRFIPTVSPRVSNSDTNIVLGKRKRTDETEVEDGQVLKSSSETRLVCDEWYRPKKCRRRI